MFGFLYVQTDIGKRWKAGFRPSSKEIAEGMFQGALPDGMPFEFDADIFKFEYGGHQLLPLRLEIEVKSGSEFIEQIISESKGH